MLVHCRLGKGRTGMLVAMLLLWQNYIGKFTLPSTNKKNKDETDQLLSEKTKLTHLQALKHF